jgi:hypothetical protein
MELSFAQVEGLAKEAKIKHIWVVFSGSEAE